MTKKIEYPIIPQDTTGLTKIRLVLNYPGNPKACCGRNVPYTRYVMLYFNKDDELVLWTKIYDEHLTLMMKHGKWEGIYSDLDNEVKEEIKWTLESYYGTASYV